MCMKTKHEKKFKKVKWLFGKEIEIPQEWNITRLIEQCIQKPKYGAGESAIEKDLKLPRYIRITDLNDDGSLRNKEWKSIKENAAKDYLLNNNDILFARTGATVGKSYLYTGEDGRCAFAGYLIRFQPDQTKLNSKFLFHYIHSIYYWKYIKSIQTWGVQPNVNAEQYSNLLILLSPIHEQQKIASILSGVDALIESTQKVIEKTKKLKKGLMQKLLTRGIGHTKFKKTESLFGRHKIPEEWDFSELGKHCTFFVPMRNKPKKFDGYIPWLRIEDLDGKFVSDTKSGQYVTSDTVKEMKLRIYPIGTILCSCSATIGVCAITKRELITNQTFIGIFPNCRINNEYLYYYLSTQKNNLIKIGSGSTILYISRKKFEEFPVNLPLIQEQQKIASILSGVDAYIQKNQQYKERLEKLKKGLMQKLLTGQIRVKV